MQSEPLKEHSPAALWSDFKEERLGMRIGLGFWSEDSLTGKEEKQPGRQSENKGVRREGKLLPVWKDGAGSLLTDHRAPGRKQPEPERRARPEGSRR